MAELSYLQFAQRVKDSTKVHTNWDDQPPRLYLFDGQSTLPLFARPTPPDRHPSKSSREAGRMHEQHGDFAGEAINSTNETTLDGWDH
jgi:hypothetical protein